MSVVDASVWVSSLVPQDVHHTASTHWLRQQLSEGDMLTIPTLALPEIAGAIARRTGANILGREAAERVRDFPGIRLVALNVDLGQRATEVAANLSLRGADAVYVAVAHTLHIPLVTWDLEIQTRVDNFIEVTEPRSAPPLQ